MKKYAFIAVALVLPLVQACQNGPSQRVLTGTAAGAILGAGVGMAAGGDDKRNAAIGAAVGAIAGAAVGGYMDEQERKLKEATAGTGIEVTRQGDQLQLTMPSNVTFTVNSATIQPGFYGPLNDVAKTLVEYPSTAVDIIGHASSDGADDYNMTLSQQRAAAVRTYLINRGTQAVRINAIGMGETQPIADNSTAEGRAANRRVEIILTPITQ
ncbi:OmpA family protein [Hyphomonas sp.]|jgi:outer membrane protein OmpA-like peptidoglycan-associated protein|uniref:OmpA family protein n=1 Tax=Hyphomonas sp. TaxID=87 RepID=UPI0025BDBE14|nr:OmpA family protein [Hyphomonas sp.]MBI1400782.1 OmpA family protein [Hyphomonas sp.]